MTRALVLLMMMAGVARAEIPVLVEDEVVRMGSIAVADEADEAAVLARLTGHEVRRTPGRVWIVGVAGEGTPWVGVVERRGRALWLVTEMGDALELRGPLARPRLAGPGYTIWVLGEPDAAERSIRVRRLGVLRAPRR